MRATTAALDDARGTSNPNTNTVTTAGEMKPQIIWMYWKTPSNRPGSGASRQPTNTKTAVETRPTVTRSRGPAAGLRNR